MIQIRSVKAIVAGCCCVLFACAASADDFKTIEGKEYKNAKVSRVEPDGIVLMTKSGISKVYFTELPKEVQERFHYDAEKAAAYSAEQAANQEAVRKQQIDAAQASPTTQTRQVRGSSGFKVEFRDGRRVYELQYKSTEELADKEGNIARGLMLPEEQVRQRMAAVPQGGEISVIVKGTNIYSANAKNFTVIVTDSSGKEILRQVGGDNIPEGIPGRTMPHWISAIVVPLKQAFNDFITVYVVNNQSGYREEFRIHREH